MRIRSQLGRCGVGLLALAGQVLAGAQAGVRAQEVVSPVYSFQIREKVEPPILTLVPGSLRFEDADGNGAVDAEERCTVRFRVTNDGLGDGTGLRAKATLQGSTAGVQVATYTDLPVAKLGATTEFVLSFQTDRRTVDGSLQLQVEVEEPRGFGLDPVVWDLVTRSFRAPKVEVVDHRLSSDGGTLARKSRFVIEWLVQNTGQGVAQSVQAEVVVPEGVYQLSGEPVTTWTSLAPGAEQRLACEFIINQQYASDRLPVSLRLREQWGTYARDWQQEFQLNQAVAQERLVVASAAADKKVERSFLGSDVDRDIPQWGAPVAHRYAVVIGNEDYASRSGSLSPEVNVDFAENDARVVAQYLQQALGVPSDQLHLRINATAGELRQEANWLSHVARAEGGRAEIFFYYSGHGLPAGADNAPYLIPVDVAGNQAQLGMALPELYRTLTAHPVLRAHVWLDACFSGGARNEELVAMKGIRVVPRADAVPEGLLVLASSSGTQASGVFRAQQHGHFTYQLLKSLQGATPDATWGSIFDAVRRSVDLATAKEGFEQQPQALASPAGQSVWPSWKLR
jgi:hypothetical protein